MSTIEGTPTTSHHVATLTVKLHNDEANAIVYAVKDGLSAEAETAAGMHPSTLPGELFSFGDRMRRMADLTAVNEQLHWRAHWGPHGGDAPDLTATAAVVLDLAGILQAAAETQDRCPDEAERFEFAQAARTLAQAFAVGTLALDAEGKSGHPVHDMSTAGVKANWRLHIGTLAALGAGDVGRDLSGSDQPEQLLAHIDALNAWADLARWATVPRAPVTEGALWALDMLRAEQVENVEVARECPDARPDGVAVEGAYLEMIDHVMTMAGREAIRA